MDTSTRALPAQVGDERTTLTGFLAFHRQTFALKCGDLDAEQLARRAAPPSSLSLLGLLRHLADAECAWFPRVLGHRDVPLPYVTADRPDAAFDGAVPDERVVDAAWAAWRAEVARAEEVAATTDLDATGTHHRVGTVSLRWVLVHMVEEYARHNGHADLLRQAIDGDTGQ